MVRAVIRPELEAPAGASSFHSSRVPLARSRRKTFGGEPPLSPDVEEAPVAAEAQRRVLGREEPRALALALLVPGKRDALAVGEERALMELGDAPARERPRVARADRKLGRGAPEA